MAKINPVKLKQEAEKLERASRPADAIALYRQIVEDNPRDWNTVKKIGDLYVRMNRNREAIGEYEKLADFYANDGFLLKAIAIWKQIQKLDASALEPYQHLAELYAKQGLMMEAKSQYQTVVDEYIKRGKTREAGQVLGKMAEVDPGDLKIRSKLADLYLREGDIARAVGEHVAIADELHKKGHLAEALQVLEKGLKLDPRSQRLRQELARVHLLQKNFDRASQLLEETLQHAPGDAQLLVRLGEAYLGARKIEEAEAIFKRLLELNPGDEEARVQMGRVYLLQDRYDAACDEFAAVADRMLARREGDRATALLGQIVQRNPAHVKSLVKLAEVYQAQHKEAAVSQTYSQLAEAYIHEGRNAEAAQTLESLIAREPQNLQHKSKLDFVRGRTGAPPAAARSPLPPLAAAAPSDELDLMDEEFELEEAAPAPPPRPFPAPAAPRTPVSMPAPSRRAIEASGPLSAEDREFIEEHVAEGRVFRKYGLIDKAADQFEAVVARFPDNLEARQELRDVYKEKGQLAKAAEQSLALAEVLRLKGDEAAAQVHETEADALMPAGVEAAPAARSAPDVPVALIEEEVGFEQSEPTLSLTHDEEEISLEVEEAGIEAPSTPTPPELGATNEVLSFDLEVEEAAGQELPTRFFEDEALPSPPAESAPVEDDVPLFEDVPEPVAAEQLEDEIVPLVSEPAADEGFSISLDEDELSLDATPPPPAPPPRAPEPPPEPVRAQPPPRPSPPPAPPLRQAPAPRAAAPVAAPGASSALQRMLEEVDQYMALGFVDDAKDALREISGRFPNHPALTAKLAELGLDVDREEAAPAAWEPEESENPFADIALDEPESLPSGATPEIEVDFSPAIAEEEAETEVAFPDDLGDTAPPAPEYAGATVEDLHGLGTPGPGFDLGNELNELFGAQAAVHEAPAESGTDFGDSGLADIFKEFKKGVDKQLGQEDYDTRYNLGIAYKEMGLLDEAIAEFQLAAKDESRLLECSSMLGICFLEKGMPKLAIKWFDRGLRVPGRTDEEYQGLRYDLAAAYESAGEADTALSLYTELYGQDANFRDVAAKVRELRAARA